MIENTEDLTRHDLTQDFQSGGEELSTDIVTMRLTKRAASLNGSIHEEGKTDHAIFNAALEIGFLFLIEAQYHFDGNSTEGIDWFATHMGEMLAESDSGLREALAMALDLPARQAALDKQNDAAMARVFGEVND